MKRRTRLWIALGVLAAVHLCVIFACFLAPYDPGEQDRAHPLTRPTRLQMKDASGSVHLRPFVTAPPGSTRRGVSEDSSSAAQPLRFFVRGAPYQIAGVFSTDWHLFGVDAPARVYLLGTDEYGRDVFSRMLHGGQISLFAGLLATGLALGLGTLVGAASGYHGRWLDEVVMRIAELFLALPWLYLLFAVRAFLPLRVGPGQAFLLIIGVLGLIGWSRPARLVRGVVLSAKERYYVVAARGFGASDLYLLRRHVLPQTAGVVLTQATLLIPQYILAEVTLSFLGLGVGEPVSSWGNMLASLQQYHILASDWWMLAPGVLLALVVFCYSTIAEALQEELGTA